MNATATDPANKIRIIKTSTRCLVFGLLGLLPLIGLAFALTALWLSFSSRRQERLLWNPAKPYQIIGSVCGATGALVWSIVDTIIIYQICNNYISS